MSTQQDIVQVYEAARMELEHALLNEQTELVAMANGPLTKLRDEVARLEKVAREMDERGLGGVLLGGQIRQKHLALQAHNEKISEKKGRISKLHGALEKLEPTFWLLRHAREHLKRETIPTIECISDLFALCETEIHEQNGHPVSIEVLFRIKDQQAQAIRHRIALAGGENRIIKGFIPQDLRWLPTSWLLTAGEGNPNHGQSQAVIKRGEHPVGLESLYFVQSENRLMPATERVGWLEPVGAKSLVQGQFTGTQRPIETDLVSFQEKIVQEINAVGNTLKLGDNYDSQSLFGFLKTVVLNRTSEFAGKPDSSANKPTSSEQALQSIESCWEQFVRNPWCPELEGLLANLKYYGERGEKPRLWPLSSPGSFGFRLRTDDSWIVGNMYLSPKNDDNRAGSALEIIPGKTRLVEYSFRMGRLCGCILGEERLPKAATD